MRGLLSSIGRGTKEVDSGREEEGDEEKSSSGSTLERENSTFVPSPIVVLTRVSSVCAVALSRLTVVSFWVRWARPICRAN